MLQTTTNKINKTKQTSRYKCTAGSGSATHNKINHLFYDVITATKQSVHTGQQ